MHAVAVVGIALSNEDFIVAFSSSSKAISMANDTDRKSLN
jgi:hypothetical protein